MPDLNQYASTIARVFQELAVLYKDESSSGELDDAAMAIVGAVDADTFAEILSAAQQVDEQ